MTAALEITTTPAFEAHHLVVRGEQRDRLDDVSVALEPGALTAVVGANGAGKSTLLRVLCGDIRPDSGEVLCDGRSMHDWRPLELARRRAVLLQQGSLRFPCTAREVVALGRAPHRGTALASSDRAAIEEALTAVEATHLADRLLSRLSGGEQKRVQLARVLCQIGATRATHAGRAGGDPPPGYLFLDEPANDLDPLHQNRLFDVLRRVVHNGHGVFVVVHDLNLAARFADRVIVLRSGRVIAEGHPREALRPESIRSAFALEVVSLEHPDLTHPLFAARANFDAAQVLAAVEETTCP